MCTRSSAGFHGGLVGRSVGRSVSACEAGRSVGQEKAGLNAVGGKLFLDTGRGRGYYISESLGQIFPSVHILKRKADRCKNSKASANSSSSLYWQSYSFYGCSYDNQTHRATAPHRRRGRFYDRCSLRAVGQRVAVLTYASHRMDYTHPWCSEEPRSWPLSPGVTNRDWKPGHHYAPAVPTASYRLPEVDVLCDARVVVGV